jgi:uncharacterized membrane protein
VSAPTPAEPPSAAETLDAVAAETPAELPLTDPTRLGLSPVAGRFARRTAELAGIYQAAITTLAWGFRLGAALLALGLIVTVAQGEALNDRAAPFAEVIPAVLDGEGRAVVDLAIVWFMATPVVTVLVVMIGFARMRDRRYAALSLAVLAILATSITLALLR